MEPSVHDLIGQIIHPRRDAATPPRAAGQVLPNEPVPVLLGRVIGPPGAGRPPR